MGVRGGLLTHSRLLRPSAPLRSGCAGCLAPRPELQQVQAFLGRGLGALGIAPIGGFSGPLGRLWGPPISSPLNPEDAKPMLMNFFPTLVFPELKEVTSWQSSEVLENTHCTRAAVFVMFGLRTTPGDPPKSPLAWGNPLDARDQKLEDRG